MYVQLIKQCQGKLIPSLSFFLLCSIQHHDPKPKESDSDDDTNVERRKPEASRLPASQRDKGPVGNTSDVSISQARCHCKQENSFANFCNSTISYWCELNLIEAPANEVLSACGTENTAKICTQYT